MERKEPNGTMAGIRLVLEEIRDLRVDFSEYNRQAAEDRKQAAEDRKQAAEDRRRFEETFRRYVDDANRREKELSRALVVIGQVGRRIVQTQSEHTVLLRKILKTLQTRGNGQRGNGQ